MVYDWCLIDATCLLQQYILYIFYCIYVYTYISWILCKLQCRYSTEAACPVTHDHGSRHTVLHIADWYGNWGSEYDIDGALPCVQVWGCEWCRAAARAPAIRPFRQQHQRECLLMRAVVRQDGSCMQGQAPKLSLWQAAKPRL